MPQVSDSNYAAVTRHRRPFSTAARPPVFLDDKTWTTHQQLESDDVQLQHHAENVTEEGDDLDAVTPAGTSSAAASTNRARLRRDEGWNDLGLDALRSEFGADAGAAQQQQQQQRRRRGHNHNDASTAG